MRFDIKQVCVFFIIVFSFFTAFAGENPSGHSDHVEAELIPETQTIQPGKTLTIAVRMKMAPEWHTYWRNGGDSGLPTEITWTLPQGFKAGPIQWPYPEKIVTPPLVSYGYHNQIFLLNNIKVPESLKDGEKVTLKARVDWLECKEMCVPGWAELSVDIPVSDKTPAAVEKWVQAFADARSKLPSKNNDWKFSLQDGRKEITLQAQAPDWLQEDPGKVNFFPYENGIIDYLQPQFESFKNGILTLNIKKNTISSTPVDTLEGIMVFDNGWRGKGSEKSLFVFAQAGTDLSPVSKINKSGLDSILLALIFSFAGGMILNLMPCVLPVLSLKILGFVKQANEDKSEAWKHGAVFTLGVLVSFWVLAGVLLILRAGGEQLGWGFQLQSPTFLIILSAFLFLFGLSMFGVFEIGTSLTALSGKGGSSGWTGSFISGVTATVVATPCTAPFMGSALGFALTQPAWISMVIFSFLGLGMAFPYVLLASMPSLLKFVPKPGRWMESMKQFMGFLLLATVLWMLLVLARQVGAMVVILTLGALLLLGVAGWIYGRWGNLAMPGKTRTISSIVSLVIVIFAMLITLKNVDVFAESPGLSVAENEGIKWEPYSAAFVDDLHQQGKPVFIDFTATWCLSCQVNERVAFSSKDVQDKFAELGINAIKADWTSRDETITSALAEFGRNSVPLYVYYPAGKEREPVILPEILTPGIVLDALDNGTSLTAK